MLVEQAAQSFELWTGCPAPREVMGRALAAALGDHQTSAEITS
jgi:shikimate 5-dehydrogenase